MAILTNSGRIAMAQSLARYDRDSSGGTYVVSGMQVQRLSDLPDGRQVYSVALPSRSVRVVPLHGGPSILTGHSLRE